MRLYIAEKPSMGREIAAVLPGPVRKGNGFIETQAGTVTWLFGHVLRQAEPQEYDARYRMWRTEDLPIVPEKWKLMVSESSAKQFAVVKQLIAQADEIIHAGDPDREGQLLVDEVLEYVGCTKPVKRILLNALDEKSIREAIQNLQPNARFFNLRQSALGRARADWLIGMNLSRAYTMAARRSGHKKLVLPIGRVKTPTLALVVRREREIENFKPVDYFNIKAVFEHHEGRFQAQWKPNEMQEGLDSENRLIDKRIAEKKLEEFGIAPLSGVITGYAKAKKQEAQRLPFSLSTLQVLAGRRFGYEPQQVLDTAQKLYERKLTTYPRSDCEYLPTNQFKDSAGILRNLAESCDTALSSWAKGADAKIRSKAWNDKKISAHHAIIPTRVKADLAKMDSVERNIYFLIAQAYIAQFYPVHTYYQTKVEVAYKQEIFTAGGRTEIDVGWKALYTAKKSKAEENEDSSKPDDTEEQGSLPPMKKGDNVEYTNGEIVKSVTRPPVRFTQATLIAAMKDIHKFVQNPEAKKQLKAVYGIGTEATRATILDELINKRRLIKESGRKKQLQPTDAGYLLVDAVPEELSYPDFTAIWEDKLHSMAEGEGSLESFLKTQIDFTAKMCRKAGTTSLAVADAVPCPLCHVGIMQKRHGKNGDFWGCSAYPRCRMSCNDKEGSPDIEGAKKRSIYTSKVGGFSSNSAGSDSRAGALPTAPRSYREIKSDDMAGLGNPYMSEEEMAAFAKEYLR